MRKAFSLIEVIISIIIIAITSVSVPLILSVSSEANKRGVVQELLLNARTHLNLVTNSAFACEYIKDKPNSMLPRFTHHQAKADARIIKNLGESHPDPNFHPGDKHTPAFNFYSKYGLDDTNRRHFVNISDYSKSFNALQEKTSNKMCIQDMLGTTRINHEAGATRDFVNDYIATVKSNSEGSPFRTKTSQPNYELKHVSVDVTSPIKNKKNIRLLGIVANIGDAPILQTRTWK